MIDDDFMIRRSYGRDSTMGLFISLYLILLAFFILLASHSDKMAKRASDAIESVNDQFDARGKAGRSPSAEGDGLASADVALQKIAGIFDLELQLSGRFSRDGGEIFEIDLPAASFFYEGSYQLRPNRRALFMQIGAALRPISADDNRVREVAFLFARGRHADSPAAKRKSLSVRRAGEIASLWQALGLNEARFSVGMRPVDEDVIVIVFRSRLAQEAPYGGRLKAWGQTE